MYRGNTRTSAIYWNQWSASSFLFNLWRHGLNAVLLVCADSVFTRASFIAANSAVCLHQCTIQTRQDMSSCNEVPDDPPVLCVPKKRLMRKTSSCPSTKDDWLHVWLIVCWHVFPYIIQNLYANRTIHCHHPLRQAPLMSKRYQCLDMVTHIHTLAC